MGRRSRVKGSTFERKVASMILKAAGSAFTKKDCYRTPMSGGHPHAGESDLIISPKLQAFFPYCVEIKHRKTWRPDRVWRAKADEAEFLNQVIDASCRDEFGRKPLVVMRGNATEIFAAAKYKSLLCWVGDLDFSSLLQAEGSEFPGRILLFRHRSILWGMFLFTDMLEILSRKTGNTV